MKDQADINLSLDIHRNERLDLRNKLVQSLQLIETVKDKLVNACELKKTVKTIDGFKNKTNNALSVISSTENTLKNINEENVKLRFQVDNSNISKIECENTQCKEMYYKE